MIEGPDQEQDQAMPALIDEKAKVELNKQSIKQLARE